MSQHHHHHTASGKNLFISVILNLVITVSQIIGGIISGSLALLSDAVHNFSDVLALVIAYIANRLSEKPHTQDKTFGYKRAEILAALFNASVLIGIGIFIIIEAFRKFYHPEKIDSLWMVGLGILSIVLNTASALLIKNDSSGNMNIKAVYLHLLTDVITSIGVILGGILMYYFHIFWVDSLISMIIALYLIRASLDLLRDSGSVLMQFTPDNIDINELVGAVEGLKEIKNIHHIHLWRLNDKEIHLEAHLDFYNNISLEEANRISRQIEQMLHDRFDIEHATLQYEYNCDDDKRLII